MQRCLYELNSLMKESLESRGKTEKQKQKQKQPQLTSVQLLSQLRDWFPNALREIQTDYVSINRTCSAIFRRIRLQMIVQLGIDKWELCFGNQIVNPEPVLVLMAWDLLQQAGNYQPTKGQSESQKGPDSKPECTDAQLRIVRDVLYKFLEEAKSKKDGSANCTVFADREGFDKKNAAPSSEIIADESREIPEEPNTAPSPEKCAVVEGQEILKETSTTSSSKD